MKQVLIMAGGTGGHVFPALAVANELTQRDVKVDWIGTEKRIEAQLVPEAGYPLHLIQVEGLRGNGALGWLLAPFRIIKAIFEVISVIREINPDVVIGLGGFASGPGGIAAWLMRKPLIIHEQNSIPGMTNRYLAKVANRVLTGFPNTFAGNAKAKWVGNPVRESIEQLNTSKQIKPFNDSTSLKLLVLGGSLGARSLNTVIPEALQSIEPALRPEVRHQCGPRHIDECKQAYQAAGVEASIEDFIADMATVYDWADLVICRAGALTVAEIAAAGVASILVPYPHAVDDHQTHNASVLVNAGAAEIIRDEALNAKDVAELIQKYGQQKQLLEVMAASARSVAKLGTAKQIADICQELADG